MSIGLSEQQNSDSSPGIPQTEEMDAFLYAVSHDLSAPLRSILGFSGILLEDFSDQLNEEGKRYLGQIQQSASLMNKQLEALLDLSRLASAPFDPIEVHLGVLLEAAVNQHIYLGSEQNIDLQIHSDPVVLADQHLIRRLLNELFSNALKFSRQQETAQITFGTEKKAGRTWFYLRDNGIGFDMAFAKKAFQPFQRLHTESEYPGIGMGLPAARKIIQRHDGSISIESAPGEGTTVWFTIPENSLK